MTIAASESPRVTPAPVREPWGKSAHFAPTQQPAPGGATGSTEGISSFARLVRGLGNEVQTGEALMRGAIASDSRGSLGAGELIALQAGVYRYSEAIDLASRLIDHATSGMKTVLQGQ